MRFCIGFLLCAAIILLAWILGQLCALASEVFCVCLVKSSVGLISESLANLGKGHLTEGNEVLRNIHSLCDKRLLKGLSRVYLNKARGLLFG